MATSRDLVTPIAVSSRLTAARHAAGARAATTAPACAVQSGVPLRGIRRRPRPAIQLLPSHLGSLLGAPTAPSGAGPTVGTTTHGCTAVEGWCLRWVASRVDSGPDPAS